MPRENLLEALPCFSLFDISGKKKLQHTSILRELAQSDKATSKEVRVWLTDQSDVWRHIIVHLLYKRTGLQCPFQLRALGNSDSPPARPPLSQFQDALQESEISE